MLSDLELNLLAGFFPHPSCCLLKFLERRCMYPSDKVYPALVSLEDRGIVKRRHSGRSVVYGLETEKEDAFHGFLAYVRLRQEEFKAGYPSTERCAMDFSHRVGAELVVLVGEYAIGEATAGSEVSLLLVSAGFIDRDGIEKVREDVETECGGRISWTLQSEGEFRDMKAMGTEYYQHVMNFGFPLKGHRQFYELVFRDENDLETRHKIAHIRQDD